VFEGWDESLEEATEAVVDDEAEEFAAEGVVEPDLEVRVRVFVWLCICMYVSLHARECV